jgi:hypothetical protein
MNWKTFLVPIALLPALINMTPAVAGSISLFQSPSGDTVFPEQAFGCAGNVVRYSTRYQGKSYQGTLRINSPKGLACEGGRGRWVKGSFEERSQDGTQRCKGQLSLYLTLDPQGGSTVQWSNIQAVPGYACSGIGTAPKLPLNYVSMYHD